MKISKIWDSLLTEAAKKKAHEFGCVMVFLDIDKKEWKTLQNLIDEDDVYDPKDDPSYGRENEPHVTILYGLHEDVPKSDVTEYIDEITEPKMKFGKVSSFENDKFDVLKFDVDSKDLHTLNKKFKKLPHTSKFPDYHPHITIAYLKSGKAKKYIALFNEQKKLDIAIDKIVYSQANGTKSNYKLKKK